MAEQRDIAENMDFVITEGTAVGIKAELKNYRILNIAEDKATAIRMDIDRLEFRTFSFSGLADAFKRGEITIEPVQTRVLDLSAITKTGLSGAMKEKIEKRKKFADQLRQEFSGQYETLASRETKPLINNGIRELGTTRRLLLQMIRRYLQSGFDDYALIDHRLVGTPPETRKTKAGRKPRLPQGKLLDTQDYENVEKYRKKYLHSRNATITGTYDVMCHECYMEDRDLKDIDGNVIGRRKILSAPDRRPTYDQFYYYCRTHTTVRERDEAKTSAQEVDNDRAVKRGSALNRIWLPGVCYDFDARECDVELISSSNPLQDVGRLTTYYGIDRATQQICCYSSAFEVNSVAGITNCLFNIIEDKQALLDKYSIDFEALKQEAIASLCNTQAVTLDLSWYRNLMLDDVWPSDIRFESYYCDHGSDFVSKELDRIMSRLNIDMNLVPVARGRKKPYVEGLNAAAKSFEATEIDERYGFISKRHDSPHKENAVMDEEAFQRKEILFILKHNMSVIRSYRRSADMIRNGVPAVPAVLHKYLVQHTGHQPVKIVNRDDFIWNLLPESKASVSRKGIIFKELPYFNNDDKDLVQKMYTAGTKRKEFIIHYDPRMMGCIYYLSSTGMLMTAYLDQNDPRLDGFRTMTYEVFCQYRVEENRQKQAAKEINTSVNGHIHEEMQDTIKEAIKKRPAGVKSSGKNIKESRAAEKSLQTPSTSVAARLGCNGLYPEQDGILIGTDCGQAVSGGNEKDSGVLSVTAEGHEQADTAGRRKEQKEPWDTDSIQKQRYEYAARLQTKMMEEAVKRG